MEYLIGTEEECDAFSSALNTNYGLPLRGAVHGGPDVLPVTTGPGWTTAICGERVDSGPNSVVQVPDFALGILDQIDVNGVTLSSRRRAEAALPPGLQTALENKRNPPDTLPP